jgi:aerobic-type carbon monoxide dehydrogenase small subunit (CoxS/CutS family)
MVRGDCRAAMVEDMPFFEFWHHKIVTILSFDYWQRAVYLQPMQVIGLRAGSAPEGEAGEVCDESRTAMRENVEFTLNGKPKTLAVEPDRMLLWVLRIDCGLTGTKYGCGESFCGACTVLVDDEAVRSCTTPVKDVAGKRVTTIEGLGEGGKLHPLQKAFMEADALQCGFCTPGMIMNAYAVLRKNPRPSAAEILHEMNDNLCRCGAHTRIIQAIQTAAAEMQGGIRNAK